MRALVLGYEVGCRVYGATRARLAVHPHGTYGPLAAAVAPGCLRGLDTPMMTRVIALAAGLGVPASRRVRYAHSGIDLVDDILAQQGAIDIATIDRIELRT